MNMEIISSKTESLSDAKSITECNEDELKQILSLAFDLVCPFEELLNEQNRLRDLAEFYAVIYGWGPKHVKDITSLGEGICDRYNISVQQLLDESRKYLNPPDKRKFKNSAYQRADNFPTIYQIMGNYGNKYSKALSVVYREEANKLQPLISEMAENLTKTVLVMVIPPAYRCSYALKTMLSFVQNMRASTWKECANLFEEHKHRLQLEVNSAEILALQYQIMLYTNQAAKSATVAAVFSGLDFFLK